MNPILKRGLLLITALCSLIDFSAKAVLLGVKPGYPNINFVSQSPTALTYDPGTHVLRVNADPTSIEFSPLDAGLIIVSNRSVQIMLDNSGAMVSGTNGFILTGDFVQIVGGVPMTYSGVLLAGDVVAFGSLDSGVTDQFDFRVQVTGGLLKSFFDCANDLAITLTSEFSTFTGSFVVDFHGTAKGRMGPEDLTPPTVTCPDVSKVMTTPAVDPNGSGASGFIITYPDPVVIDNCDPHPTLFCDVPSGTFLPLAPGDSVTNTCYGIDAAGNYDFCTFVVVAIPPTGSIGFTDGGCHPVTLTNDLGKCSATYTFQLPVATNGSGQVFEATATVVDQGGASVALTPLGNGLVMGEFPRTTVGTNIITFTANDGHGNSAVRQCLVQVVDREAPSMVCLDQTATFVPILTNAVSRIQGEFGCNDISDSSTIWFSSVLSMPSRGSGTFSVRFFDQQIELDIDKGTNLVVVVPEAVVTFSNGVVVATTTFVEGKWVTVAKPSWRDETFLSGSAFAVPFDLDGCHNRACRYSHCYEGRRKREHHGNIKATWCGRFEVSDPGVVVKWAWAAAVYSRFGTDYSQIGVKPVDSRNDSGYNNNDAAGTPEFFKQFVVAGARGDGRWSKCGDQGSKYTGELTDFRKANLGVGTVCFGAVNFQPPVVSDNCDAAVAAVCTPPSGSIFGPGTHLISCTATDSSGNSNQCSFTLTVLSPLQVVLDSPCDDNLNDNTRQRDAGFSAMNCPDDPSTVQQVNRFSVGDKLCHVVRLLDCNGADVTEAMSPFVTVHIDVTERDGTYASSFLVNDLPENSSTVGSPGGLMVPVAGKFKYNLETAAFEPATVNTTRFFRSCVWVDYNSAPGVPVGMEDVVFKSR